MPTYTSQVIAVMAMGVGLFACADETSRCGDGEAVDVNGSSYCVYKESIVIVGGFDCPASMPYRIDFQSATVCGDRGFDNVDVPEDVCARAFVPCTEPNESDAGMAPLRCGDRVCSPPNATGSCRDGTCVPVMCHPGFSDCDGMADNGCEISLNTADNCGACGSACDTPWCQAGECLSWPPLYPDAGPGEPRSCLRVLPETCDGIDNDCDGLVDDLIGADGCALPNAESLCNIGTCFLVTCNAGFGNCDGNPTTGCETALNTLTNCGGCGVECSGASMTCATGECLAEAQP